MSVVKKLLQVFIAMVLVGTASAQNSPPGRAGSLEQLQQVADAKGSADNAWMLVSAALVLMMTGPGLALFYGGLVRRKNVLNTVMQSFAMAIIMPALISGAFAERMKFSAMAVFMALWSVIVYAPMAHMVWGKGGLLNSNLGGRFPTLDFAGGTVVHITSGLSALVCALYLGKRIGYPKEPAWPHSVVISFIGACLLWVGWFGFNAGSALSASSLATSAFVATHFAAASAAIGWAGAEWLHDGGPSALGAISGCVAGLVAITPASGYVGPMPALLIGLIAGVVCFAMVAKVKARFGYDDSLDAFTTGREQRRKSVDSG